MIEDVIRDADQRMSKGIDALKHELSKIRTGRAYPGLLEHITVSYYNGKVPLNQVAHIHVLDARTLSVTPWDKSVMPEVEKAILNADLGLNPVAAGGVIRVPLPPLTEERRKELIRVVKAAAEKARVVARNIRRNANHSFKNMVKEKLIGEDGQSKAEGQIQKTTDKYIAAIDEILANKEKEMMEI